MESWMCIVVNVVHCMMSLHNTLYHITVFEDSGIRLDWCLLDLAQLYGIPVLPWQFPLPSMFGICIVHNWTSPFFPLCVAVLCSSCFRSYWFVLCFPHSSWGFFWRSKAKELGPDAPAEAGNGAHWGIVWCTVHFLESMNSAPFPEVNPGWWIIWKRKKRRTSFQRLKRRCLHITILWLISGPGHSFFSF